MCCSFSKNIYPFLNLKNLLAISVTVIQASHHSIEHTLIGSLTFLQNFLHVTEYYVHSTGK